MYSIAAFYKFAPLSEQRVLDLRASLNQAARSHEIVGLLLLGPEGCNGTVAGQRDSLDAFLHSVRGEGEFRELEVKYSTSERRPFRRFKIDLRQELITLRRGGEIANEESYLSPTEWHSWLRSENEQPIVLDVRNDYETALGVFTGAVTLPIDKFSQFPEAVAAANIPRDKPVLMYCTGGIRCEKALVELQRQGFERVYQLHGGILKYLEEYPEGSFEGECFVFDHRVAVDRFLQPSTRYSLCPHCGDPAEERISCSECGTSTVVCVECLKLTERRACSKNCAYHLRRRGGTRSEPQP